MATVVATKLLTFAVEKVGSAVAGKVFEKGLAYISGGTDTDKIQQSISDVLKEVQQVKAAVTEMSKKLDEGILRLRKDTLGGPLADIESYYSSVQDCIDQALVDKKDIQDQAALKEALTKLQTRLESKLKLAADNVPGYLGRVDDFLQDKEFLNAGADQAWQKSDDFLAYYMKMKVLFVPYWVIVVKGITLLEMARLSPNVSFDEAPQTIKRLTEKVKEQEKAFSEAVGNNTCLLAEYILAEPTSWRSIAWFSGWGNGIDLVRREMSPVASYNVPRVRDDAERHKYLLEVTTTLSALKFDLSKSYPIRIWADQGLGVIIRSKGRLPIFLWGGECVDSAWYIKPISIGSDHYRFVGADGENVNAVLVTGWNENRLEHRQDIDVKSGFDGRPDRAYFQVNPWN